MVGIDKNEFKVAENRDLLKMNGLRKAILQNFKQIWMFLHNNKGNYTLTVNNVWGGPITPEMGEKIKSFSDAYLSGNEKKTKKTSKPTNKKN
jgi:hypothetical protein